MLLFRYEKIAIALLAVVVLWLNMSTWRKATDMSKVVGMVTALTTNATGHVVVYVDIKIGGNDAR